MRSSQMFTKSTKTAKEYDSKNATLLIKAAFINQLMAGVYTYLPLGQRVLSKIENIIREEMDKVSNEILMPALSPKENWETTNRLGIDVLMKASGANEDSIKRNDTEYILNPTHEDIVTPLVQNFVTSYKDLPVSVYQIQNKFRNEARPKSGIMRGREFRMKDAYSFHESEESFKSYYDLMKEVYTRIFERLGIGDKTVIALASGGDFTDDYSHEFQTILDAGEDVLFLDDTTGTYYNREVAPSKAPEVDYSEDKKEIEEVLGEGIIGVEELANYLNIKVEQTTKTILFHSDKGFIAGAVRGGYDIDEGKLKKTLDLKELRMANEEEVMDLTRSKPGYAGILNLPDHVTIVIDESCDNRVNFEMGANRENYHTININWDRDIKRPEKFYDIKVTKEGDLNPKNNKPYEYMSAAEVGNIFPLYSKFPNAFDFKFVNKEGKSEEIIMGCYGIGPTRIMGVIAELFNDENGLIWPEQIAPYKVHLLSLGKDEQVIKKAEELYKDLSDKNIEVLWDDRDVNPGEKFSDSDLIGIPHRVVVSKRSLENGGVEYKKRNEENSEVISMEKFIEEVS